MLVGLVDGCELVGWALVGDLWGIVGELLGCERLALTRTPASTVLLRAGSWLAGWRRREREREREHGKKEEGKIDWRQWANSERMLNQEPPHPGSSWNAKAEHAHSVSPNLAITGRRVMAPRFPMFDPATASGRS